MDLQTAWALAAKDFKIFRRKSTVIYATVVIPLVIGVAFPVIIQVVLSRGIGGRLVGGNTITSLMDAFSLWFLTGAAVIPSAIASYSLVGEKLQKSMEPLLATPMTDSEILLGKTISGLLIPVAALYAGAIIFMALMDAVTQSTLGYLYYPNWHIAVILLSAPLASLMSVQLNILVSSRVNDVRTAQQLGTYTIAPFVLLYFLSEFGILQLNDTSLLIVAGVIGVAAVALFYVAKATFQREEILTKWK